MKRSLPLPKSLRVPLLLSMIVASLIFAQQGRLAGILVKPENIIFVGNKSISAEDLKAIFRNAGTLTAQLSPQSMDTYDGDRITHGLNTVLAFYRNRGFIKASITPPEINFGASHSEGKIQMVLNVTENQAYHLGQINVNGARALSKPLLVSLLNLQPNSPINLSKINSGVLAIREAYLTLGYLDVEAKTVLDAPDGKKVADLIVDITEGNQYHVGKIELVGNAPIKESLIREFLPLQSGDIFGQRAFESCLQSLNELGITPVLTASDLTFSYESNKALVNLAIHLEGKSKK